MSDTVLVNRPNVTKLVTASTFTVITSPDTTIYSMSVDADTEIPSEYSIIRVAGNGGDVMLTSTPTIEAGQYDGQTLRIVGQDDSAVVTLQDNVNLPGSTLHCQHARNVVLGKNDNITFIWDLSQGVWIACSIAIDTY